MSDTRLGDRRSRIKTIVTLVTGQALSALSNFMVLYLLGRGASAATFGAYSLALNAYSASLGIFRAYFVFPRLRSVDYARSDRAVLPSAAIGVGGAAGLLLTLLGVALRGPTFAPFLIVGLSMPVLLAQDALRFESIINRRAHVAAYLDAAWLLSALFAISLFPGVRHDPPRLLGAWVIGAALPTAIVFWRARLVPSWNHLLSACRENPGAGRRYSADFALTYGASLASFALFGTYAGLKSLGEYRLVLTAFAPTNVVMTGLVSGLPPHLEAEHRRGSGAALAVSGMAVLLVAPYVVAIASIPASWSQKVFGHGWIDNRSWIIATAGASLVSMFAAGPIAVGRAAGMASTALRVATLSSVSTFIVPIGLMFLAANPTTGFAVGFLVQAAITTVLWWTFSRGKFARGSK